MPHSSTTETEEVRTNMATLEQLPELLTPAEVAEVLRTTTNSLSQDRYLRRGLAYHRAGRRILYARADVLAYLAAGRSAAPQCD